MREPKRQAGRAGCWLALWLVLSSLAAAQEDGAAEPRGLPPTAPCWPPPCVGQSCDPCDLLKSACPGPCDKILTPPRPPWYVVADGAGIRRDVSTRFIAATLGPVLADGSGPVVLTTGALDADFKPAGRFLLGRTIGECLQIEGSYLGVPRTESNAAVRDSSVNALGTAGNLYSPFSFFGTDAPIPGLDYNNFAQIRFTSSFQSVELNVRRQLPMTWERLTSSILFGVRYMSIPEEFEYMTLSNVPAPGGSANLALVSTDNQLIGPQIGAKFDFYIENRWWVNVEIKGAVLNNRSGQSTSYQHIDGAGTESYLNSRREDHTAFLGDLSVTGVYRWSPHFTTRLGYQAMWIRELALASDNLSTNIDILTLGPAVLNHSSRTVYHGPFAGIVVSW